MATGGIFQLITNDGKQDRMLMASALLKQRIDAARARRVASGNTDCTPTLYDIERTHILFTNAHFKPFAAIGYEYNKVSASAGASILGSSVTFSIPQFGDFFNDMVVHAVIRQPDLQTGTSTNISDHNLMRWCSYPGERLLKNVKFEVNGNPLDEYNSDAVNFHREFSVQPNKKTGWGRCMGQEELEEGSLDQPNWVNSGVGPSAVVSRTVVSSKSGNQTPTGQKSVNSDGDLELFIPLLFWCNKDPRLSVPSVAIPYGQRFINIDLASQDELVGIVGRGANAADPYSDNTVATGGGLTAGSATLKFIELYINNIFVNPEVHNIFIKRIGFTLIRVHRKQTASTDGASEESILLQQLKWPIEALFIGVRPTNYNSSTASIRRANLDKWHKFSSITDTTRTTQGWLSNKRSIVTGTDTNTVLGITVTGDLVVNITGATTLPNFTTATAGSLVHIKTGSIITVTNSSGTFTGTVLVNDGTIITFAEFAATTLNGQIINGTAVNAATFISITTFENTEVSSKVAVCQPTIEWITIKAHGIPIYNKFPAKFYNAYIPLNYGGPNIKTPDDCGAMLITFCLYPGTYQPSGHINVSRAREFYIDFNTTNAIGGGTTGTLIVIASAINFLLISDGSAVLRYST
jgi:hypothetical protein